jgi:hypothetical protein
MKDEIRFLYCKQDKLNTQLYQAHLQAAATRNPSWDMISTSVHHTLNVLTKDKYQSLHGKLHRMKTQNTNTHADNIQFYPRIINNTNITFTDDENALLQKGLKYNLHIKPKQWLQKLAMEAETAISLLQPPEQNPVRYLIVKNLE